MGVGERVVVWKLMLYNREQGTARKEVYEKVRRVGSGAQRSSAQRETHDERPVNVGAIVGSEGLFLISVLALPGRSLQSGRRLWECTAELGPPTFRSSYQWLPEGKTANLGESALGERVLTTQQPGQGKEVCKGHQKRVLLLSPSPPHSFPNTLPLKTISSLECEGMQSRGAKFGNA